MAKAGEPRRVCLTTISQSTTAASNFPSVNDAAGSSSFTATAFVRLGGDFLAPEAPAVAGKTNPSKTNANKSVRLNIELFETDSNKYPEFNFSKLVQLEKKKAKKLKAKVTPNGGGPSADPFEDNDDDVARIAKQMEEKYGNTYATGRGRKKDDFCDIGMGYDENDSFIDNTEAYDEVIPEEVETVEGGFYINCGALEFKNLNKKSGTTRTDEIIKMPERSRKRLLSTSTEESSSSEEDNGEDEDDEDDEEDEEDENGSESESLEDEDVGTAPNDKKKYKPAEKRTKSDKQKLNNENSKKSSKKMAITTSSSSNSPRPSALETSDTDERQAQALKKVVKTTTIKDMLKAKRDSFLKSQGDNAVKGVVNGEVKCTSTDIDSDSENGGADSPTEQSAKADKIPKAKDGVENLRTADTILPATLDADILGTINCFKDMVRSRDMCGKKFFFDEKLTALLLKVYEALLCTERNERNMVFAHLEYQLQLPKYFILRKSKALRSKEEKNKTTVALEKLRKAVVEIMPKTITNYEMELRKFAELQAADVNAEHPPKMPRKKFHWTNELRELLYGVYQARWTSYAVLGKRKDSLEEFINGYLKEKVVDLWATGWMRYEDLQREIERHKNASKKAKEKNKKSSSAVAQSAMGSTVEPSPNAYLKQMEEFTRAAHSSSRANSDTDSATSASSNSLKRKFKEIPTITTNTTTTATTVTAAPKSTNKPARKKAMKQHQQVVPKLDKILEMPSTSAQAASLNSVALNASGPLDLVSPTRKTDHSIYSIMTAAASMATGAAVTSQQLTTLHSKLSSARTLPHVINLDDYKSPSDILQTSKQLAAANYTTKIPARTTNNLPRRESSSESDGVEIVGVFPATTKTQNVGVGNKPKSNHKNKSVPNAAAAVPVSLPNAPNGALGFNLENMYVFNNNKTKVNTAAAMHANTTPFDYTSNQQIMKTISDLKVLEKQLNWPYPMPQGGSLKGAGAGPGAPAHQ